MKAITIEIFESSNEPGYMYNIYDKEVGQIDEEIDDAIDGGMCTGSMEDALQMAMDQAMPLAIKSDEIEVEQVLVNYKEKMALIDSLEMNIEGCRIDEEGHGTYIELMKSLITKIKNE